MKRAAGVVASAAVVLLAAAAWLLTRGGADGQRTSLDLDADAAAAADQTVADQTAADRGTRSGTGGLVAGRVAADAPVPVVPAGEPPPDAIGGLVLDAGGAPVVGAGVTAHAQADGTDEPEPPAVGTSATDARGRFLMPAPDPRLTYLLRASARGHAKATVVATAGQSVRIQLMASGAIHGWVRRGSQGIAGCVVVLSDMDRMWPWTAGVVSDREGHYRIDGVPVGRDFPIAFLPPGGVPVVLQAGLKEPGEALLNVELPVATAVRGDVTDVETGQPIAGATILSGDGHALASSSADGAFALEVPAGRPVMLAARARGYARVDLYAKFAYGEPDARLRIALFRGATIDGCVLHASGLPLAGALVTVESAAADALPPDASVARQARELMPALPGASVGEPRLQAVTMTDAQGRFVLAGLPMHRGYLAARVRATLAGHAAHASEPVQICLPQRSANVTVRLSRGATIEGRVLHDGVGCAAWVTATAGGSEHSGHADASGCFALHGLPPGEITLRASAQFTRDGATRVWMGRARPAVAEGARVRADIVLDEDVTLSRRTVRGRVLDASMRPMPGLEVRARFGGESFWRAETGTDGRFTIDVQASGLEARADLEVSSRRKVRENFVQETILEARQGVATDQDIEVVVSERGIVRLEIIENGRRSRADGLGITWNGMRLAPEPDAGGVIIIRPPLGKGVLTLPRFGAPFRIEATAVPADQSPPPLRIELPRLVWCDLVFSDDHPLPLSCSLLLVHEQDLEQCPARWWDGRRGLDLRARVWTPNQTPRRFGTQLLPGPYLLRASRDDIELVPDRIVIEPGADRRSIPVDWRRRR